MSRNKSTISQADTYEGIGEYWDHHDLSEVWDATEPAEIVVDLRSQRHYFSLERALSEQVRRVARAQGVSAETLINLWVQDQLRRAEG